MRKFTTDTMKIVVTDDSRVFVKVEKKQTCSTRNINSVSVSKWEQKSAYNFKYISIDQWLENIGAVEADFRASVKF